MTGNLQTSKLLSCSIIFHSSKMNIYYFSCTLTCPDEDQNSHSVKCQVDPSRLFLEKGKYILAGTPVRDFSFLFFLGGWFEGTPVPKSNIQYCHNHFSYSVLYKAVFSHHFTRKSANKVKYDGKDISRNVQDHQT